MLMLMLGKSLTAILALRYVSGVGALDLQVSLQTVSTPDRAPQIANSSERLL